MDISEINDDEIEIQGDFLLSIFDAQREAEKEFAEVEGIPHRLAFGKLDNLHHPEVCRHINDNIYWRLVQEVNEAVVALKNAKTWRQTKYFTDVHEYLDEVADIMIYFVNACLASGIDPEMLTKTVLKKIQINLERIRTKY